MPSVPGSDSLVLPSNPFVTPSNPFVILSEAKDLPSSGAREILRFAQDDRRQWLDVDEAAQDEGAKEGASFSVRFAPAIRLTLQDLRFRRRLAPAGRLLLFVVDASGSMAGQRRIAFAKGAIEALLLDAYRRRDRVAMIAFRGNGAELVLPPTNSTDLAHRRARDLAAGGRTPLAAALTLAQRVVAGHADRAQGPAPVVVVLSDGRANVALDGGDPWDDALRAAARLRQSDAVVAVVDVGGGFDFGITTALGQALGAPCFHLPLLARSPSAMPVRWS